MSMENVQFEARPNANGGDPGKLAYLHDANWQGKAFVQGTRVDDRCCPGCLFPDAKPGKWPHVKDARCSKKKFPAAIPGLLSDGHVVTLTSAGDSQ